MNRQKDRQTDRERDTHSDNDWNYSGWKGRWKGAWSTLGPRCGPAQSPTSHKSVTCPLVPPPFYRLLTLEAFPCLHTPCSSLHRSPLLYTTTPCCRSRVTCYLQFLDSDGLMGKVSFLPFWILNVGIHWGVCSGSLNLDLGVNPRSAHYCVFIRNLFIGINITKLKPA